MQRTGKRRRGGALLSYIVSLAVFLAVFSGGGFQSRAAKEELLGCWFSYENWNRLPKEEKKFKNAVDEVMENCRSFGLNAIFVHARSDADAYYPDSAFAPVSKFCSEDGEQGGKLSYDPFAYMVESAHAHGLEIHAWMNPYRVTGYLQNWQDVSSESPVKRWLNDGTKDNDRNVLRHGGQYYLNPSKEDVIAQVAGQAAEIASRYDVDGIHFDDYFYPAVDDSLKSGSFDKADYEWQAKKDPDTAAKTLPQWRRDNVSRLMYRTNRAIKAANPDCVFGVSPQGYAEHLRSDRQLFVDIDRWVSERGFVDYIMPQLYWGFEPKKDGETAPWAFQNNLKTWIGLKNKGAGVKLYLGLGLYRGGTDVSDGNGISEWIRKDDIIMREVEAGRESGEVSGYCFFSYSSFFDPQNAKERKNLLKIL